MSQKQKFLISLRPSFATHLTPLELLLFWISQDMEIAMDSTEFFLIYISTIELSQRPQS